MKLFRYTLSYIFFSFLIFGMWEWVQTPFFMDISPKINDIVYFRIHCTGGDILILTSSILVVSILKRDVNWVYSPKLKDYFFVTLIGILYTGFSEILNVVIRKSWSYSDLMPTITKYQIGVIPLIQWLVLPTVIIYVSKRFFSGK